MVRVRKKEKQRKKVRFKLSISETTKIYMELLSYTDTRFGDDLEASGSSDDEENGEENDDEDETKKRKNKKGKKPAKQKKRKYGSDDEAFEDSDDGDGEGRELDYISSSDGQR